MSKRGDVALKVLPGGPQGWPCARRAAAAAGSGRGRAVAPRYYGTDRARGLSDVIGGHVTLDEALRETASTNVRFVPTGTMPPNPV